MSKRNILFIECDIRLSRSTGPLPGLGRSSGDENYIHYSHRIAQTTVCR